MVLWIALWPEGYIVSRKEELLIGFEHVLIR